MIGKNTIDAIRSGVVFGYAGAIDAILRRLYDELGERADVVATGGLARTWSSRTPRRSRGRRPADADRAAAAARAQLLAARSASWARCRAALAARLDEPWTLGPPARAQPRAARAAGRDRQLVRAPAGQALRRRAWRSRRWSRRTRSTTATSGRARRCCASTRASAAGGPVSIQLFGEDPDDDALGGRARRRSAARTRSTSTWAARCRRCARPAPAPRCSPTPTARSRVARAAVEGARRRAGAAGDGQAALGAARRRDERLRRSRTGSSPRRASRRSPSTRARAAVQHKGAPDYELAARWSTTLPAPVILTGGLTTPRACARRSSRPARPR